MTPDNVSPALLTNNAVSSVLDFSTVQKTREVLTNQTVIVGGKTYTFFVNVFPKDPGPGLLIDPREIAAALVSAINLDVDGSGVYYDSVLLQSANASAEAYARGAVVTIVSRTGSPVVIGGDSGGTPTPPSGSAGVLPDVFDTGVTGGDVPQPFTVSDTTSVTNFSVDNLDQSLPLYVQREGSITYVIIPPRTGKTFSGSPANYEQFSDAATAVPFQVTMRFN